VYTAQCLKIYRCFGGKEEGGWWYDRAYVVEEYKGKKRAAKKAFKQMKEEARQANSYIRHKRHSVLGSYDYDVYFGRNPRPIDSGRVIYS